MELIINLIIIFIIIVTVLKRLKDVSKKGQELEKTKLPGEFAETIERRTVQEKPESKPLLVPAPEISFDEMVEPVEFPLKPAEELLESRFKETFPVMPETYRKPVPEMAPHLYDEITRRRRRCMKLAFTHNRVINGIIMSEILSKPVSLRDYERL
jgi:hypothetical protein